MRIEVSEIVDRPVDVVFAFMVHDHVQNHPRWDPYMDLEQVTDGPMEVGTVIKRHRRHFDPPVDGTMEVIGYEENESLAVRIQDGDFPPFESVATYEALGSDQTRMTMAVDMSWLDEDSDTSQISEPMQRSAGNIKALIEAET